MKLIPFSKDWSKLSQRLFITLRKSEKAQVGEVVKIYNKPNVVVFKACCLLVMKSTLGELSTALLCYDTDTHTRAAAIAEIQQFYKTSLTDDSVFYLHLFQKEVQDP